ncbi:unnamed protein product, partial [Amoebophrya sp. A25]
NLAATQIVKYYRGYRVEEVNLPLSVLQEDTKFEDRELLQQVETMTQAVEDEAQEHAWVDFAVAT